MMAPSQIAYAPNLVSFLKSLKEQPLESSIENLIALLKRRQIRNSRPCAIATVQLLSRVVARFKWTDIDELLMRIQQVGQRLMEAQPKEMVVGNIVRHVLYLMRNEAKEDRHKVLVANSQPGSPRQEDNGSALERPAIFSSMPTFKPVRHSALKHMDMPDGGGDDVLSTPVEQEQVSRPPVITSHTSYAVLSGVPVEQSMFNLLSATPPVSSPIATPPGAQSPPGKTSVNTAPLARMSTNIQYLTAEFVSIVEDYVDEVNQVDEQIAAYALEHIHSNEIILTHSSSGTVQKFLLKAALKRKFTVIHAESYPNNHEDTHATVMGSLRTVDDEEDEMSSVSFQQALTAAGITVIVITDAAVFALMSRVNKVILGTHAVVANGGLVAVAGARVIAKAAHKHRTPVIVLSGLYQLNPEYPFEFESFIEYGDTSKVISYEDGDLLDKLDVDNPLFDYVPPDLVDLYITNLGSHPPSYLYRIIKDQYYAEDVHFDKPELNFKGTDDISGSIEEEHILRHDGAEKVVSG